MIVPDMTSLSPSSRSALTPLTPVAPFKSKVDFSFCSTPVSDCTQLPLSCSLSIATTCRSFSSSSPKSSRCISADLFSPIAPSSPTLSSLSLEALPSWPSTPPSPALRSFSSLPTAPSSAIPSRKSRVKGSKRRSRSARGRLSRGSERGGDEEEDEPLQVLTGKVEAGRAASSSWGQWSGPAVNSDDEEEEAERCSGRGQSRCDISRAFILSDLY